MTYTLPRDRAGQQKMPGIRSRHTLRRLLRIMTRSALRHECVVEASARLSKCIFDLGKLPQVHHPEEQPVEFSLEIDHAIIALTHSRLGLCGFPLGGSG